ncbi:MAG: endonuclease/exonuclease/phosphatase family protein [Halioglobus sp.]
MLSAFFRYRGAKHPAMPKFGKPRRWPVLLGTALTLLFVQSANALPTDHQCSDALGSSIDAPAQVLDTPIRMLSWNIQKSGSVGWDLDLRDFASDRNLLLIQEASAQTSINDALPQTLFEAFAAGYSTARKTTGVLTLSSASPSLQCNFTAWEPWLRTPKATIITEFQLADTDERLLVINLHAVNFTVGLEDFISQLETLTPLIARHQGPLLLAGDFNTWSDGRQGFIDSFMARHQLAAVTFQPDGRTRFRDKPLDHIYLRGLKTLNAETKVVQTSDHNPLLLTLELIL